MMYKPFVLIIVSDGDAAGEGSFPGRHIYSVRFATRQAALLARDRLTIEGKSSLIGAFIIYDSIDAREIIDAES